MQPDRAPARRRPDRLRLIASVSGHRLPSLSGLPGSGRRCRRPLPSWRWPPPRRRRPPHSDVRTTGGRRPRARRASAMSGISTAGTSTAAIAVSKAVSKRQLEVGHRARVVHALAIERAEQVVEPEGGQPAVVVDDHELGRAFVDLVGEAGERVEVVGVAEDELVRRRRLGVGADRRRVGVVGAGRLADREGEVAPRLGEMTEGMGALAGRHRLPAEGRRRGARPRRSRRRLPWSRCPSPKRCRRWRARRCRRPRPNCRSPWRSAPAPRTPRRSPG